MAKSFATNEDPVVKATGRIARGIRQAYLAALLSDGKQRVGAAVYNGVSCISVASNTMTKSHPKSVDVYEWPYPHAEWNAMNAIPRGSNPKNLTVFVTRVLQNDDQAIAKPCRECHRFLTEMGVKAVYYTDNDGFVRRMNSGLSE